MLFCVGFSFGQDKKLFDQKKKPLLSVRKTGAYLGIQQGKYRQLEFGAEMQFKQVKLVQLKRMPLIWVSTITLNKTF